MKIRFRKITAAAFAAAFCISITGCGNNADTAASADDYLIDELIEETYEEPYLIDEIPETDSSADKSKRNSGTVLRIASYNDEIQNVFELIYGEENLPEGIKLEYEFNWDYRDEYPEMLEQSFLTDDEPIDIFLVEPDYIQRFINSGYTLPLSDAGITEEDTEEMFPYTVSLGMSDDGVFKAASWHAEPGIFVYRRDIALEVFGNDDPDYINEIISYDWEGTASALAEKGYYMTASASETYRIYGQNRDMPWIDDDGNVVVDNSVRLWAEDMHRDIQNGYNMNIPMWTDSWINEQTSHGKTFGFVLASWYSEQLIPMWSDPESAGKFGLCLPPKPYYWGGAYLCISSETDNLDLCGEIIKALTCDGEKMIRFTEETRDCCNNRSALKAFAESDYGYSEFYGQNTFELYIASAENVEAKHLTPYDLALDDYFITAMTDYFNDDCDYEKSENIFYVYIEDNELL